MVAFDLLTTIVHLVYIVHLVVFGWLTVIVDLVVLTGSVIVHLVPLHTLISLCNGPAL